MIDRQRYVFVVWLLCENSKTPKQRGKEKKGKERKGKERKGRTLCTEPLQVPEENDTLTAESGLRSVQEMEHEEEQVSTCVNGKEGKGKEGKERQEKVKGGVRCATTLLP